MSHCRPPHLQPRITVCPNGCAHLQLGPAIVLLPVSSLRALIQVAEQAIASLPADSANHHPIN